MHEIVYIWNMNQSPPPSPTKKKLFLFIIQLYRPYYLASQKFKVFLVKKLILQEHISICWLSAEKILDVHVNFCTFHNPSTINIARARQRCWLSAKNIIKQELSHSTTRTIRIVKFYGQPVPLSGNTFHKMETNQTKTIPSNGTIRKQLLHL